MHKNRGKRASYQRWHSIRLNLAFGIVLFIASATLAFLYISLAPWPIYRVVACLLLLILWSNIAGVIAHKSRAQQALPHLETMRLPAIHARTGRSLSHPHALPVIPRKGGDMPHRQHKLHCSTDTDIYLVALRRTFERRGNS